LIAQLSLPLSPGAAGLDIPAIYAAVLAASNDLSDHFDANAIARNGIAASLGGNSNVVSYEKTVTTTTNWKSLEVSGPPRTLPEVSRKRTVCTKG
jgi:hypothetical protein